MKSHTDIAQKTDLKVSQMPFIVKNAEGKVLAGFKEKNAAVRFTASRPTATIVTNPDKR